MNGDQLIQCQICDRMIKKRWTTIIEEIVVCGDCYFKTMMMKKRGML